MANSILSQEFVFAAIEAEKSGNQFPIDFEDVWNILGYSRKDSAKRALKSKLIENHDFHIDVERSTTVLSGYVNKNIQLTIEGFKMLCMMAETFEGREVRMYFIEIEKAYIVQLQRQLDATIAAPITKPSKRLKSLEDDVVNLQKENQQLVKKNEEYREDLERLFEESELLKNNICNKTDFELSIDDIIACLNPLPTSDYSTKRYWIEGIVFNDGIRGTDWIHTTLGVRVNYRFLIELAIFYRGVVGISSDILPDTLILEKARIYKNDQNQINTRYPNKGI